MKPVKLSSRVTQRVKIQTLFSEGYGVMQIVRKLKVSKRTVQKWVKSKTVSDKKKSGRPTKCTPTTKLTIRKEIREKLGASSRKCARVLNTSKNCENRGKTISYKTIQRQLKKTKWGKTAHKQPTKPLMSEKSTEDRQKFAISWRNPGVSDPGELPGYSSTMCSGGTNPLSDCTLK